MKICFLASAGSIHTAKWSNYFVSRGHQVEVLSFESPKSVDPRVNVHRLGRALPLRVHYFAYGGVVRRLLSQIRPDILHAHYCSGYGTLGRLANFHPYVLSVWGSDIFDFPEQSPLHRSLIRANLKVADHLCSTSQVMADEVQRCCREQVTLTPFGVDCDQFRPMNDGQQKDEFVVGVVKTLEPKYGIEYLIRGFAIFCKKAARKRAKLKLVIAGAGMLRSQIERLVSELNISEQTAFLGAIPHERVPSLLNRLSVFVAPSILKSESFGVAVVEASASGIPVVVSNIGGLPEVVKDRVTGILVPPRNPEAIASALEELWKDVKLRAELGANGRKFVLENYEWTENAGRMERLYESILARA
jgi:L-malate glycosyltransferase